MNNAFHSSGLYFTTQVDCRCQQRHLLRVETLREREPDVRDHHRRGELRVLTRPAAAVAVPAAREACSEGLRALAAVVAEPTDAVVVRGAARVDGVARRVAGAAAVAVAAGPAVPREPAARAHTLGLAFRPSDQPAAVEKLRHLGLRRALELATAAQARAAGEADVLHRCIRASASQLDHLLGLAGDPDDILEHGSFTPPPEVLQHSSDEPLLRVMDLFLRARGMSPGLAPPPVVVSLSGGVDSMVLTQLLLYLRPLWGFRVVAVHIDYANRSEGGTLPPPLHPVSDY